jgi:hypothetical protein
LEEALQPEKEETEEEKKKKQDSKINAVKRELVQIYSKGTYTGVHDGYSPTKRSAGKVDLDADIIEPNQAMHTDLTQHQDFDSKYILAFLVCSNVEGDE